MADEQRADEAGRRMHLGVVAGILEGIDVRGLGEGRRTGEHRERARERVKAQRFQEHHR
ncbi:MAG: hypothetical protein WDN03_04845 [Rhizomicrobium sp.]